MKRLYLSGACTVINSNYINICLCMMMYHGEYNLSVSQSPKKLPNPLAKLSISWAFCSLGPNRKVLELRRWLGNVALFFSGASEKAGWDCDHGASCEYDLP